MLNKNVDKKLLAYSAFSGVLLLLKNEGKSQAIYTNIDPDIVLNADFELAEIDMDHDGTMDFRFFNASFNIYSTDLGFNVTYKAILCGPYGTSQNAIAGRYHFGYYPYALNCGSVIGNNLNFYNWGDQRMAYQLYFPFPLQTTYVLQDYGGFWYPQVLDHCLGVRFIDTEGNNHYGWIRCDVEDTGRTIVIKDYAYELKPDTPIKACDTIGDTSSAIENTAGLNAVIYSFNKTIYVHLPEITPATEIYIYNTTGKLIYDEADRNQYTKIQLNDADGIYLVEITDGKNKYGKKVMLR